MVRGSILENGLNVLKLWKYHSSYFHKILSVKVETIFREIKEKCQKLFKSKFSHRKIFKNWFWSYLQLKNECSETWKWHFPLFCKYLNDEVETVFWESEEKFLHKLYFLRNVLENTFQLHFGHSNVLNVLNVSIWISNWSYSSYSITIIRNQLRYLLWAVPQFNLMFLFISYFKLFVTLGSSSQLYLLSKWSQNCLSWLEKISRVDKFLCFSLPKNRKTTIVNAKIISLICIANKAIGASVFGESYLLK